MRTQQNEKRILPSKIYHCRESQLALLSAVFLFEEFRLLKNKLKHKQLFVFLIWLKLKNCVNSMQWHNICSISDDVDELKHYT